MSTQRDTATLAFRFLDAGGTELITFQRIGPVTVTDRNGQTALLFRKASLETIPSGTRTIKVTIFCDRYDGTGCDGYVDNISAVMNLK